jgi:hypothetical protein
VPVPDVVVLDVVMPDVVTFRVPLLAASSPDDDREEQERAEREQEGQRLLDGVQRPQVERVDLVDRVQQGHSASM